jgi:hypothetical protein
MFNVLRKSQPRHLLKLRSNFFLFISSNIFAFRNGFELSITIHITGEHYNSFAVCVQDGSGRNGLLSLGAAHLSNTVARTSGFYKNQGDEHGHAKKPGQHPSGMAGAQK